MRKNIYVFSLLSIILFTGCVHIEDQDHKAQDLQIMDVGAVDKEILSTSENIANDVVELYGIDDVTAIVFNDDVLVGVTLASEQKMTEDMIKSITTTIKDNYPYIEDVHLSLDKKTFTQIDNIIIDLLKGKSYDTYVDEISKIKKRIKDEE
ncbi:MAG TPA: YhcN/YlaJ family sporulation lipoprotein [Tissierellaceae bacterium]|nr:YhcN/YlaJ family sporulation lipoprotein [Tissierellaceae bacterium]